MKAEVISSWLKLEYDSSFPLRIVVDKYVYSFPSSLVNVFFNIEPEGCKPVVSYLKKYGKYYKYIFTRQPELLSLPNAVFFHSCTSWVYNYPNYTAEDWTKEFGVSTVVGDKNFMPGHKLRQKLWLRQNEIKIPYHFYASRNSLLGQQSKNPILGGSKVPLFTDCYHIVIESERAANYFSEKILDCFVTRSVPIYWGAPNIGEVFNIEGIIVVDSLEEIIKACNNLSVEDYWKRLAFVEDNFIAALPFVHDPVIQIRKVLEGYF